MTPHCPPGLPWQLVGPKSKMAPVFQNLAAPQSILPSLMKPSSTYTLGPLTPSQLFLNPIQPPQFWTSERCICGRWIKCILKNQPNIQGLKNTLKHCPSIPFRKMVRRSFVCGTQWMLGGLAAVPVLAPAATASRLRTMLTGSMERMGAGNCYNIETYINWHVRHTFFKGAWPSRVCPGSTGMGQIWTQCQNKSFHLPVHITAAAVLV